LVSDRERGRKSDIHQISGLDKLREDIFRERDALGFSLTHFHPFALARNLQRSGSWTDRRVCDFLD
jgi:hypothetical protein